MIFQSPAAPKLALPCGERDPTDLKIGDVMIRDIVHSTSLQCRFNGYVRKHYSVAQHQVLVAALAELDGQPHEVIVGCLIHDAGETYTGDIVIPIKERLTEFKELERRIDAPVYARFGLFPVPELKKTIKKYDWIACRLEARNLLHYIPVWSVVEAIPEKYHDVAKPLLQNMTPGEAARMYGDWLADYGFQVPLDLRSTWWDRIRQWVRNQLSSV